MVFLLKLMAVPLYPLGFCITVLVAGLVVSRFYRREGTMIVGAGIGLLYLLSTPFVSHLLLRTLEMPYYRAAPVPDDYRTIVVLGGGGVPIVPPRTEAEIGEAGDRILHAARLYKRGFGDRIITSGEINVGSFHMKVTEGEHNARLLFEIGVDSSAVIRDRKSRTTAEHGPNIAEILDSLHLPKKIILVTSATHMARSVRVFRKHGISVIPAATDFQSNIYLIDNVKDFFPAASALLNTTRVFHEYYGIIGYKVFGKI